MNNEKVLNIYSDNVHISFAPKTKTKETKEKKEKVIDQNKVIGKSKIIAILLAIFLGRFGAHKFYLGKPAIGFLYLIFSRYQIIVFLCFCDCLIYLFMSNEVWLKEYGYKKREERMAG